MTGKYFVLFIFGILIAIVTSHNLPKRAEKSPHPETESQNSATALSQKDSGSQKAEQTKTKKEPHPTETKQTSKTKEPKKECSKDCRPSWLGLVTRFLGTVNSNTHPMCSFKTFFPECGKSTTASCGTSDAGTFVCCPLHCLKEINACWQGTDMTDVCIPKMVPPTWATKMAKAYFSLG